MSSKPPNTSDGTWLGATVIVSSAAASFVGLVALIWKDAITLLAIGFGATLALAIALWAINAAQRRRIADLEGEVAERVRQVSELTGMAAKQAESNHAAIEAVLWTANGLAA